MPHKSSPAIRLGSKKKRKGRLTQKGHQLDARAQQDISVLLADKPLRKELLIKYLHLIQDRWSHISSRHLMALANILKLPPYRGPMQIKVCVDSKAQAELVFIPFAYVQATAN